MRHSSNTITLSEELIVEDEITEQKPAIPLSGSPSGYHGNRPAKNASSELAANESKGKTKLEGSLTRLVRLVANVTESYTSVIFVADTKNKILHSLAHHSLSRDYIEGVQIPYGKGLVGWTAENKVRITVCPFEHDASTLLYYPSDQGLKSFIAVPILTEDKEIIGVIACDSKKSYAFAKITEKILTECAAQAQLLIDLHQANEALSSKRKMPKSEDALNSFIEKLRTATSESSLFETTCSLSQSILKRDAMIALVTSNEGYGEATFYSHTPDARVEHHLMDLVCKNKKIISTEKSVHVLPSDDIRARSFLSVPFHVYGKEAGALNILSAAFEPFSTNDIQTLEQLAKVIGRELERHRSKAIAHSRQIGPSLLPWKHFAQKSEAMLFSHPGENSLLRVQLTDLLSIESTLGVEICSEVHEQLIRFVQQLAPNPMLASAPYGTSIFVFGPSGYIETVKSRLSNLVSRIHAVEGMQFSKKLDSSASQLLLDSLSMAMVHANRKTKTVFEMISLLAEGEAPQKSIFSFISRPEKEKTCLKSEVSTQISKADKASEDVPHLTAKEDISDFDKARRELARTEKPTDTEVTAPDNLQSESSDPTFLAGPSSLGVATPGKGQKSIEEFILGNSASTFRSRKNARFW